MLKEHNLKALTKASATPRQPGYRWEATKMASIGLPSSASFRQTKIKFAGKEITIGDGNVGPFSAKLFKDLMDIQYGKTDDPFHWIMPVT